MHWKLCQGVLSLCPQQHFTHITSLFYPRCSPGGIHWGEIVVKVIDKAETNRESAKNLNALQRDIRASSSNNLMSLLWRWKKLAISKWSVYGQTLQNRLLDTCNQDECPLSMSYDYVKCTDALTCRAVLWTSLVSGTVDGQIKIPEDLDTE